MGTFILVLIALALGAIGVRQYDKLLYGLKIWWQTIKIKVLLIATVAIFILFVALTK